MLFYIKQSGKAAIDQVAFEQGPQFSTGKNLVNIGRKFPVERIVNAKAMR